MKFQTYLRSSSGIFISENCTFLSLMNRFKLLESASQSFGKVQMARALRHSSACSMRDDGVNGFNGSVFFL